MKKIVLDGVSYSQACKASGYSCDEKGNYKFDKTPKSLCMTLKSAVDNFRKKQKEIRARCETETLLRDQVKNRAKLVTKTE